ncbi:proclotting enzyme-like [Galendromus occidentalis]|uniref:CLIP domain-containing serine protease n=1 Tax=Galendromus occidentalis TaxID=34638 RepID=A0AAJ6QNC1_9ACAR|nr:proclotting enzyme-like [Galendromus occidentalis]
MLRSRVLNFWLVGSVIVARGRSLDTEISTVEEVLKKGVQGFLDIFEIPARWRFPSENEQPCDTPTGDIGRCISIRRCHGLLKIRDIEFLRSFICGFEAGTPLLCCPPGYRRTNSTIPMAQEPQRIPVFPDQGTSVVYPPDRPFEPQRPRPVVALPHHTPPPPQRLKKPPFPHGVHPPRTTTTTTTPKPKPRPALAGFNGRPIQPKFLPTSCGFSNVSLSRVVGGSEAHPGAWPWMAAIFVRNRGTFIQACGGALVSHRHVVTAAHCFGGGNRPQTLHPSVFVVRLGDHNIAEVSELPKGSTIDVAVERVKRHPAFNPRSYLNDIGLLYLAADAPFTRYIHPVCLPFKAVPDDITGEHAFVTGWGYTKYEGRGSNVLKQALIRIWSQEECAKAFQKEVQITQEYLCAGDGQGLQDSCQGDSGGPLVYFDDDRFYLIGVVSFGKRCATPGYPGAYTRITKYLEWLRDNF